MLSYIVSINPFVCTFSTIDLVILCHSYNNKVRFHLTADRNIQMNPAELIGLIQANIDKEINDLKTE